MTDFEQWLAAYRVRIAAREKANAAREEEAAALRAATAAASATVSSQDGSVTVDVDGHLRGIRFGPNALSDNPSRLAALVMRSVTDARRAAGEQLIEVYEQTETGAAATGRLRARVAELNGPGEQNPVNAFDELAAGGPEPAAPPPPAKPSWPTPPRAPIPVARPTRRARATRAVPDDPDDFSEENPW